MRRAGTTGGGGWGFPGVGRLPRGIFARGGRGSFPESTEAGNSSRALGLFTGVPKGVK